MPIVTGEITRDGATIVLTVGVSRNRQRMLEKVGHPVPSRITVRAEIDTGSFATGFMPEVFPLLGIEPFRDILVRTPSTRVGEPCRCDQYDVSVTLVSADTEVVFPSVYAIKGDFDAEPGKVQAIIGRDILARCIFSYFGPDKTFQLAF